MHPGYTFKLVESCLQSLESVPIIIEVSLAASRYVLVVVLTQPRIHCYSLYLIPLSHFTLLTTDRECESWQKRSELLQEV